VSATTTGRTLADLEKNREVGQGFSVPSGSGTLTEDGRRYRIEWHIGGVVHKALFRVHGRTAILQHIRRFRVSQCVDDRVSELDGDADLEDVPLPLLRTMNDDGFYPVRVER